MEKVSNRFFIDNIQRALNWLFDIQDKDNFGWAWVRDISPNIQNTCEVIYSTSFYLDVLSDAQKEKFCNAVDSWLIDIIGNGAEVSIELVWAIHAIKKVLDVYDDFYYIDLKGNKKTFTTEKKQLLEQMEITINSLFCLKNNDNGFPENPRQVSNTIRTSHVVSALFDVRKYFDSNDYVKLINECEKVVADAAVFIVNHQNSDGGFGNMLETDIDSSFVKAMNKKNIKGSIREEQYLSSDAVTAYAILALEKYNPDHYYKSIKSGTNFLLKNQHDDGGFDMLHEVNIKDNYAYTFRHFGLAWAVLAFANSRIVNVYDKCLHKAINNLLSLQDETEGGFMSNPNSDCYTWATCNALTSFAFVEKEFLNLTGTDYNDIIFEWWHTKHKPINKPKVLNIVFGLVALVISLVLNVYLICSVSLNYSTEGSIIITMLSIVFIFYILSIMSYILYRIRRNEKKC